MYLIGLLVVHDFLIIGGNPLSLVFLLQSLAFLPHFALVEFLKYASRRRVLRARGEILHLSDLQFYTFTVVHAPL